jgi:uncharacterized protein
MMETHDAVLQGQIERIVEVVHREYVADSPTHDLSHLVRVAALASRICSAEGGDKLIAVSAAWLHDLHRGLSAGDNRFFVAPEDLDNAAVSILKEADIPETVHGAILEAIHYTDRFSFSDRATYATSIEAKAVRDADSLDAIGAIGVARAFSFGGAHGIPLYSDHDSPPDRIYRQSERPSSTIQHFYDKLLRLAGDLETATAVELSLRRSKYLIEFIDQFREEWDEDMRSESIRLLFHMADRIGACPVILRAGIDGFCA